MCSSDLGEFARRYFSTTAAAIRAIGAAAKSLLFGYVGEFLYEGDAPLAERRAQALTLDATLLAELLGRVGEVLGLVGRWVYTLEGLQDKIRDQDQLELKLVIKDHRFAPVELTAPAGQKLKLVIENQDPTPEEFESHSLNREKLIPAGAKAVIYIGPLKPGRYDFMGEFNPSTAKGVVVAE